MSSHTSASDNVFSDFITTASSPNVIDNISRTTLPTNEKVMSCPTVPKYTTSKGVAPSGGQFYIIKNFTPQLHAVFYFVGDYSKMEKTIIDSGSILFELVKDKASVRVEDVTERLQKKQPISGNFTSKLVEFGGRELRIYTVQRCLQVIEAKTIGNVLEVTAREPSQAKGSYRMKALFILNDDLQNLELGTAPYDDDKFIKMVEYLKGFSPEKKPMYFSPFRLTEKDQGWQVTGLMKGNINQTCSYYPFKNFCSKYDQSVFVRDFAGSNVEVVIQNFERRQPINVITRPSDPIDLPSGSIQKFTCDEIGSRFLLTIYFDDEVYFTTGIISEKAICPGCEVNKRFNDREAVLVISNFINYGDEFVLVYTVD